MKYIIVNEKNGKIMRLNLITVFFLTVLNLSFASQYFVAPDGNDSNPGTIDQPVESIQQAQTFVGLGDTVYIRGGLYSVRENQISSYQQNGLFACISYLSKSGSAGHTIKYWAYPGEQPVFDFSAVKPDSHRVAGIYITGSYIHIKGLEMTGIQVTIDYEHTESYCIYSRGNNNIFEQISMHDNVGTGLRHYNGGGNLFLNCDSYKNWDNVSEEKEGRSSDGFGCHPNSSGTGNVFKGCRAWFNADDGFDIIRADESVVFDSCWAFYNGYSPSFQSLGDGNGFKAGGYAYDTSGLPNPVPRNTIRFCIAVRNKANGFYSNHHLGGNDWYNNSAYQNPTNFNMVNRESPESDNIWVNGFDHVLKNNLSYQKGFGYKHTAYLDTAQNTSEYNSFDLPITLTDDDFVSLEMDSLTSPRKEGGRLPDIDFMRPVPGSEIIDAGVDIGFPFLDNAPDLGAFEVKNITAINDYDECVPDKIILFQNYPNPFNPITTIRYALDKPAYVTLIVYNFNGQKVKTLTQQYQNAGKFKVQWDSRNDLGDQVSSGVYFYRLKMSNSSGSYLVQKKMLFLK
jgi:hypothetical protein